MLLKKTIILIGLIYIFSSTNAQNHEKHPVDPISYTGASIIPEVVLIGSNNPGIGIACSFRYGQYIHSTTIREYIFELSPGFNLLVYPELLYNFKIKTSFRMGIPLEAGIQYNHISNFYNLKYHSLEILFGLSKDISYRSNYLDYFKILCGYDLIFFTNNINYNFFPLRIHINFGFNIFR